MGRGQLQGRGVSGGIAIGPAFVFRRSRGAQRRSLRPEEAAGELERLHSALALAQNELAATREKMHDEVGAGEAAIFGAQLLMLGDPELVEKAERAIQEGFRNAEWAIEGAGEEVASGLAALSDEYLRARAVDVRDVASRVVAVLQGRTEHPMADLREAVVVVGEELMPSDTAHMDRGKVLGFVTEGGSSVSHAAILARTMGIPAVVGASGAVAAIMPGDTVVADGDTGAVLARPDATELGAWRARREGWWARQEGLRHLAALPAVTTDGHRVELAANIGSLEDVAAALGHGAEGVGLFRTEFLFMGRASPPDEEEQFEAYRGVAEAVAGRPVIIRTLDVGGDKLIPWLGTLNEANPFLGLRGIRLCLAREEVFLTQLRALLRARACGDVRIMFPMVADADEVRAARRLLEKAAAQLGEGGASAGDLPVGIMVELPAAALLADVLLREVDFVSIGTNDLTQYTLAVDRTNATVAPLADALHPAVLRLIAGVAEAGRRQGKWVGVCGDLAGEPLAAPVLVGLGVEELSMAPSLLSAVKEAVRAVSRSGAEDVARKALACRTAAEVRELLGHRGE